MLGARKLACLLVLGLSGCNCEYLGAIGLLMGEYDDERREEQQRLEDCGTCPAGEHCNLLMDPAECRPIGALEGDPCGAWKGRVTPEHQFGCDEPLVCNAALDPAVCVLPCPAGSACHHGGHCTADTWCDEFVCVPTLAVGAECGDHDTCRPNVCFYDGTQRTCERPHAIGEPCHDALDCAPSLACDEGRCIALP